MNFANFHPIHVLGGQCVVSGDPETTLMTVLGSCVSACIYDPLLGIGGMNHFILPTSDMEAGERSERYGDVAMRTLVDALYDLGAERWRLQAKLYGGRSRYGRASDIGAVNAAFAVSFLQSEGIKLTDTGLGENLARWVTFHPATGRVKLKETAESSTPTPAGNQRAARALR